MRDKKLIILVVTAIVLNLGHVIDHVARGDLPLPLGEKSVPFIAFVLVTNAILGFGLYFYVTGKIGPLFWAIFGALGIAIGWLGHFSPFTEQTPQYICRAYTSPIVGGLADRWRSRRRVACRAHGRVDRRGRLRGISVGARIEELSAGRHKRAARCLLPDRS